MVYKRSTCRFESLRVEISRMGVPSGHRTLVGDISLDTQSGVLEFMAGAAAIVGICGLDFEDKLHTFTSDLCVMLRQKPELNMQISEDEKSMVYLAQCRRS